MQYCYLVLERAEPLIEIGQLKNIDVKFVKTILNGNQVVYAFKEEENEVILEASSLSCITLKSWHKSSEVFGLPIVYLLHPSGE